MHVCVMYGVAMVAFVHAGCSWTALDWCFLSVVHVAHHHTILPIPTSPLILDSR